MNNNMYSDISNKWTTLIHSSTSERDKSNNIIIPNIIIIIITIIDPSISNSDTNPQDTKAPTIPPPVLTSLPVSKDTLTINSGTFIINVDNNGIKGKGSGA